MLLNLPSNDTANLSHRRPPLRSFDMRVSFRVLCMIFTCAFFFVLNSTQVEIDKNLSPVVRTESGAVVGKIENLPYGKSVHKYLGIPYAEPPVGKLRFAAPEPIRPWSGVKRATDFGAPCPQPSVSYRDTEINFTRSGMACMCFRPVSNAVPKSCRTQFII